MRRFSQRALPANGARVAAATAALYLPRFLSYQPRVRDMQFVMDEVLDMYTHYRQLPFAAGDGAVRVGKSDVTDLLEHSAQLATDTLLPLYQTGDSEGCQLQSDGTVRTPAGFKAAYEALIKEGWVGLTLPTACGGQGLPISVGFATREVMATANWPLCMYADLAAAACRTVQTWANEELKERYLPPLVEGKWGGTVCVTEPHCGSDVGQIQTRAEPVDETESTYRITGTKVLISAGDHDLTENIVHMVLARLPQSPPGSKGLSLFLVPRHVVQADGSLDAKRNVQCTRVEEKMGLRGNATCQLEFRDSIGYLLGDPGEGLRQLFTFMNAGQIGCALQGVCHAELTFQNGLRYARERGGGTGNASASSSSSSPSSLSALASDASDGIIQYPNVRQNLLIAKAFAEAGRAFTLDIARLLDLHAVTTDPRVAKELSDEIGFYTPIAKACLTEWGLEAASRCLQVWGGHGYLKENGMEQIVRDARIGPIYEGATSAQAMDFLTRKVLHPGGSVQAKKFGRRVNTLVRSHKYSAGDVGVNARQLWLLQKQWRVAMSRIALSAQTTPGAVGAASEDFLFYTGYLVLGYYWMRMGLAAKAKVKAGLDRDGFYQAKVDTCNFVFDRILPRADAHYRSMNAPPSLCNYAPETWGL